MTEEPVGVATVAAYLGVTEKTVCVYARNGQIPGFKLSNQAGWRFYISEIREHLTKPVDPWADTPRKVRSRR